MSGKDRQKAGERGGGAAWLPARVMFRKWVEWRMRGSGFAQCIVYGTQGHKMVGHAVT